MGPSRRAVLFDLDGVLTPTADYHQAAWGDMFGAFLAARGAAPWTPADYFAHLDGRRRDEGIRALLADRGIDLPEGDPAEGPGPDTVAGLGERKNAMFGERIAAGVDPYPGSVAYLDHLAALPEPPAVAVVSSSRNTHAVLAAAGLAERFAVVLDGTRAHALGLAGKPAPDTYLRAAAELGVAPAAATVVEDAVSGVAAGHAGGFGEVIGVDRGAGAAALAAAGADRVVADLAELIR